MLIIRGSDVLDDVFALFTANFQVVPGQRPNFAKCRLEDFQITKIRKPCSLMKTTVFANDGKLLDHRTKAATFYLWLEH